MSNGIRDISAAYCEFYGRPWQCNRGPGGSQCLPCHRTQRYTSPTAAAIALNTAPQKPTLTAMDTAQWHNMGLVTLTNFDSEEDMLQILERLGVAPERITFYRTPSGALRGTGVLWNRKGRPHGMD